MKMCQNYFLKFVYSGISNRVNVLRRSSILPFAENVTTSHLQMFLNFFVIAVGITEKSNQKCTEHQPKEYILNKLIKKQLQIEN